MKMETKSAIIVVEVDCSGSIGNHSKKDGNGQDPSLWRFLNGKKLPYHLKSEELTILPQKNEKDVFEDI